MKIYEIGLPDHYDDNSNDGCDCTIWIASNVKIELTTNPENTQVYIKEVENKTVVDAINSGKMPLHQIGIDLIITNEKV